MDELFGDDYPKVNPYVVLADITVALSLLLLCLYASSVWNDEAIWRSDRFKRQSALEDTLVGVLEKEFGHKVTKNEIPKGEKARGTYWQEFLYVDSVNGKRLAKVQRNSNIQRIQLFFNLFAPGTSVEDPVQAERYARIITEVSQDVRRGLPYLFLHGVVERHEREFAQKFLFSQQQKRLAAAFQAGQTVSPPAKVTNLSIEKQWAEHSILLSQNRAAHIKVWLERSGAVGDRYISPAEALQRNTVPFGDVIPYGTGTLLLLRGNDSPGRVDVVLFYAESSKDLEALRASE